MEPFVIDCSFALAWCFLDERTPRTDSVQAWLKQTYAVAPPLWRWEVANGLLVGSRRGRISRQDALDALLRFDNMPIRLDADAPALSLSFMYTNADAHGLTVYDASYLELARRHRYPLATLDKALASAAASLGIQVL